MSRGEDAIQVALVGCGAWGRYILRDLLSLGVRVTVVDRNPVNRPLAAEGGAHAVVERLADLGEVDGAVIAVQTTLHGAVVRQLLPRKIPVFCEKPLCLDPLEATRLAAEAEGRLFIMDKWRYHPGIEALAEVARSGRLGPVLGLRTHRVGWGIAHPDVDAVWILAPHELSIALEVLGALPRPQMAQAEVALGVATSMVGILGPDPWCVFEVSSRTTDRLRRVQLHCAQGVAVLTDPYAAHVQLFPMSDPFDTKRPDPELVPVSQEFPLLRELRAFVEHLQGGPPPRSSAREGVAIVQAVAELRRLAGLDAR